MTIGPFSGNDFGAIRRLFRPGVQLISGPAYRNGYERTRWASGTPLSPGTAPRAHPGPLFRHPCHARRVTPRDRTDSLPNSPQVEHQAPRMVRGRYPESDSNHQVGNGVQGRNRTNDTRIFSRTDGLIRQEKAEEAKRVFRGPTEPLSPTEPMPNPDSAVRPNRIVTRRHVTGPDHRDRAGSEPVRHYARAARRRVPTCSVLAGSPRLATTLSQSASDSGRRLIENPPPAGPQSAACSIRYLPWRPNFHERSVRITIRSLNSTAGRQTFGSWKSPGSSRCP